MSKNNLHMMIPPQAIDVEEAVLGALMLNEDAFITIENLLNTSSFYKTQHQTVFEVIKHLHKKEYKVDLLMVTQLLKDWNQLEDIGGPLFITKLTSRVASAAHIELHARTIAEKYILRELNKLGLETEKQVYENIDSDEIITNITRRIDEIQNSCSIANSGSQINQVIKDEVLNIEKDCNRTSSNHTPGITTGFRSLDTNTGGWRDGNLSILAARPGIGKTSFALQFALEAARAGYWVNFFSLEMNKEDLIRIILSIESGVYRSNIRDGVLNEDDWNKINKAIANIENLPILFLDAAGMTVTQIQSVIRKNKKNERCDFAIIDYLQLVKSSQTKAIRELEVSEISRTLKVTALNSNIPILTLSQLNRAAENDSPKLYHLRESGAIEQDADLVLFLHKFGNKVIRLNVAKHRRGSLGEIDIEANSQMTKFSEVETFPFESTQDYNPSAFIEPLNNQHDEK